MESISMDYDKRLLFLAVSLVFASSIQASIALQEKASFIQKSIIEPSEMAMIQNNTLMPVASVNLIQPQTLGSLVGFEPEQIDILLDKIIFRESSGNPKVCNKLYGCRMGMGLAGFISSTWNETLDRMNCAGKFDTITCFKSYLPEKCNEKIKFPISKERTEAVFNGECNRFIAKWLLIKDGIRHWEQWSGPYGI